MLDFLIILVHSTINADGPFSQSRSHFICVIILIIKGHLMRMRTSAMLARGKNYFPFPNLAHQFTALTD